MKSVSALTSREDMRARPACATAPGAPGMEAFTATAGHHGRHDAHTHGPRLDPLALALT